MAKRKTTITFTLSPKAKKRLISELLLVKNKIGENGNNDDRLEKINQILKNNGGRINFDTSVLGKEESDFIAQLLGDISYYFFGVN